MGNKIQKVGSKYSERQDFILFDVYIKGNWQPRGSVEDIAEYFGIKSVPVHLCATIDEAVSYVKSNPLSKISKEELAIEGLVGRPIKELKDRTGNRVIVKIKVKDFE
ncbi:MAG: RNA ligase family protein [Bacilli bacterium]